MTSPDDRWPRPEPARDIVESSPREWGAARRWRAVRQWLGGQRPAGGPRRGIAVLAAAALLVGLAAGYAAGSRHRTASAAARPSRSAGRASGFTPTTDGVAGQQGRLCSVQVGHELQLGVEITNQSAQRMVIEKVWPELPLGGLQAVSQSRGTCGELPAADAATANVVPAGGSAWFTVTFKVLVPCPGALPVQFGLTFGIPGEAPGHRSLQVTGRLPGFVDLGGVPYAGCRVA
jgi:hypothetical protein